jgi:hypothetical protein
MKDAAMRRQTKASVTGNSMERPRTLEKTTKSAAVKSSTRGYRIDMLQPHFLHLPLRSR